MQVFVRHIKMAAAKTVKPALSTLRFLLFSTIPISFVVFLLDTSGILYRISRIMDPVMGFWDLPGEALWVFIISVFSNIYSAIGVINILHFSLREITILATICFIAHSFFAESLVMKKTGSSLLKMILLRLFCSLAGGWILHFILPDSLGMEGPGLHTSASPELVGLDLDRLESRLIPWLISTGLLVLKIVFIIFGIMFIQKILEEFNSKQILSKITAPLMSIMGLSPNTGYVWIAANVTGVVYSSDILVEEIRSGSLSESEADIFNHHIAINHGQLEDTLPFIMILGIPYIWTVLPRFILACIIVWVKRGRMVLFRRAFRVKIESD
jgi:spore maturation protein SpmB